MLRFRYLLFYFVLLIMTLWIHQGYGLAIGELTSQYSGDTIRQLKSQEMFKYMNLSADPCEDFYEYNCGNYAQYNHVSASKPMAAMGEFLASELETKIKNALENDFTDDTESDKQMKNFYRSCRKESLSVDYTNRLKSIISEFGDMPIVDSFWWSEIDFDWVTTLASMMYKTGFDIIFHIHVAPDYIDNSIKRVYLEQIGTLFLGSRDMYINEAYASILEFAAESMSIFFGRHLGVQDKSLALEKAWEILNFETVLARCIVDQSAGEDKPHEIVFPINMEELHSKYLKVGDLKRLINTALGSDVAEVYVQTSYVERVMKLLEDTPKEVVANYIYFKYILQFSFLATPDAETYCLTETRKHFFKNQDNRIYRKYFTREGEEFIYGMWRHLKITLRDTLISARLNWLHGDTKREALEKLKKLKLVIKSYDEPEVTQTVAELDINDYDFVHNLDMIYSANGQLARDRFNQATPSRHYGLEATHAAAYVVENNEVWIPMSFLQPYATWSSSYPDVYNFAVLGSYLAHEIIHGFDDRGRHYDAKGNMRSWWDADTDQEFRVRKECFVQQYQQYTFGGQQLPEKKVQTENIADGGGVRMAFEAYLRWYQEQSDKSDYDLESKSFPDFHNFSHEQMYFIIYAQNWCASIDPSVEPLILSDIHSPFPVRAVAPLANYEKFAEVFNCPRGTAMNPVAKCSIY